MPDAAFNQLISYTDSDSHVVHAIVVLRLSENHVTRAMHVYASTPSERTLLALGTCLFRLEQARQGVEYMLGASDLEAAVSVQAQEGDHRLTREVIAA
jgi:hypothetical protein